MKWRTWELLANVAGAANIFRLLYFREQYRRLPLARLEERVHPRYLIGHACLPNQSDKGTCMGRLALTSE